MIAEPEGAGIDTLLVNPLHDLPGGRVATSNDGLTTASLAERNLLRGLSMAVPSGQRVAKGSATRRWPTNESGAGTTMRRALHARMRTATTRASTAQQRCGSTSFEKPNCNNAPAISTPMAGVVSHLGQVGGTIVAEVLVGLILADKHSYINQQPKWHPDHHRHATRAARSK